MAWDKALVAALEALWGLEAPPRNPEVVVSIPRPRGFVVAERRIRLRGGPWLAYWVRKEGKSSLQVARDLAKALRARGYRVLGLKDAHAVAYQYVFLEDGEARESVEGAGWRAWLVGSHRDPGLGGHQWNNFRLTLRILEGTPEGACRALVSLEHVPGYYGPQRFGVTRPNSHLQGLLHLLGGHGLLQAEMGHAYPLGGGPGGYEGKSLREAGRLGDPLRSPLGAPLGLLREAVQAYLWNRALSRALEGDLEGYVERASRTPCPQQTRALLARLPSRSLLASRGPWPRLVREVMAEEGIPGWVLPPSAPMRPLAVEPCRISCRAAGDSIIVWLSLPRGVYATAAVRAGVWVDWLSS